MPSNTPFLMGSGEGVAPPAGAARALPAAGLPSAAPHAAATDVFRKSRRDASLLISPPQDVKSGARRQEARTGAYMLTTRTKAPSFSNAPRTAAILFNIW